VRLEGGWSARRSHIALRPKRQQLGLLQVDAAVGLSVSTAKISLAERGQVHDAVFLTAYENWLNAPA
jgi:hypothetical protein